MADNPNEPSFEAAFNQLQEMVQRLEAGNLPLDETTRLYEEGMRMAQVCNQLLNAAEQRIVQLHDSYADVQRPAPEDGDGGGEESDEGEDGDDDEEEPGASRPS